MHNVSVASVATDEHGNIEIVADLSALTLLVDFDEEDEGGAAAHRILFHPAAIGNRMAGYGLDTPEEAIDALVREHAMRLSTLAPLSDELVHQLGGTDDRIKVEHSAAAAKGRKATLGTHADTIKAAVEYFAAPDTETTDQAQ